MAVKYKISFVSYGNPRGYYDTVKEFNDERHFENYLNLCGKDESRRKVIGTEKIYSENKEFTTNDLREAFKAGKATDFNSFEEFYKNHFKRDLL